MCGQETGNGEYWVLPSAKVFVLPHMVEHYIEKHPYLPPKELTDHAEKVFTGSEARNYLRPLTSEEIDKLEKEHEDRMNGVVGKNAKSIEQAEDSRALRAIHSSLLEIVARDLEAKEAPL
jgi:hypothetical protein